MEAFFQTGIFCIMRIISGLVIYSFIILGNFLLIDTSVALAGDTGLATTLHDIAHKGGRSCIVRHSHTGKGSGATRKIALKEARRSWMAFTTMEYGTDWGSYQKAVDKIEHCSRDAGEDSCTVVARPCKAVWKRRYVRRLRKRSRTRKRRY